MFLNRGSGKTLYFIEYLYRNIGLESGICFHSKGKTLNQYQYLIENKWYFSYVQIQIISSYLTNTNPMFL
jgi:hypothetical protein